MDLQSTRACVDPITPPQSNVRLSDDGYAIDDGPEICPCGMPVTRPFEVSNCTRNFFCRGNGLLRRIVFALCFAHHSRLSPGFSPSAWQSASPVSEMAKAYRLPHLHQAPHRTATESIPIARGPRIVLRHRRHPAIRECKFWTVPYRAALSAAPSDRCYRQA